MEDSSVVAPPPPRVQGMDSWLEQRHRLLRLEQDEERKQLLEKLQQLSPQECQDAGLSLLSVDVAETWTSLFGRTTMQIARMDKSKAVLPTHSLRVGDEVSLYSPKLQHTEFADSSRCSGVVSKVTQTTIEIVTSPIDELDLVPPLRLDMAVSEATNKKLNATLAELKAPHETPGWPMMNIVFEGAPFVFGTPVRIESFNTGLNSSQVAAIENALGCPHFALIHGPPGTGKTTAMTEVILQAVLRRQKLLVCAPSNVAVDNLLEKLSQYALLPRALVKPRMVRLGHPARVNPAIQRYCLDAAIESDDAQEIIFDIRKEISGIRRAMSKTRAQFEKRAMRSELKALSKDVRKRERRIVSEIIRTSDIILCTTVGAASSLLRDIVFDVCVIDEAAQAIDVSCWIPMLRSSKCIMSGDHCQLPPTIKSKEAEKGGLGDTLFQQLIKRDVDKISSRMLDTQYRMNNMINDWASREMYEGLLKSAPGNAVHTLDGLGVDASNIDNDDRGEGRRVSIAALGDMGSAVLLLLDTSGCNMLEGGGLEEGGSYRNEGEARLVIQHIHLLVAAGVEEKEIGVITPYNAQVQLLKLLVRESAHPNVQVKTVDGFQGGEKEAIILSFVRSNDKRSVGFLADKRRINVAVTRARRHLAVICDVETCSSDPFLGRFIQYVSEVGEHRSAAELTIEDDVTGGYTGPVAAVSTVIPATNPAPQTQQAIIAGDSTNATSTGIESSSSMTNANKKKKKKKGKYDNNGTASIAAVVSVAPVMVGRKGVLPQATTAEEKVRVRGSFQALIDGFVSSDIAGGVVDVYTIDTANILDSSGSGGDIFEYAVVKEWLASVSGEHKTVLVTGRGTAATLASGVAVEEVEAVTQAPIVFVVDLVFSNCLEFPVCLTSFHRLLIHELCEGGSARGKGLSHASIDGPTGRYIEVYKKQEKKRMAVAKTSVQAAEGKVGAGAGFEVLAEGGRVEEDGIAAADNSSDDSSSSSSSDTGGEIRIPAVAANAPPTRNAPAANSNDNKNNKSKKQKKNSSNKKASKPASAVEAGEGEGGVEELDDMAFMDLEIAKNKEYAEYRKYRVSATSFPNPFKADVKSRLHTLADGQSGRRMGSSSSSSSTAGGRGAGGGTRTRGGATATATFTTTMQDEPQVARARRTKVLKKPPKQYVGGKLGKGDTNDT